MSIERIKAAIEQLSLEDGAELAAWLNGWRDNSWDELSPRPMRVASKTQRSVWDIPNSLGATGEAFYAMIDI